ncbi:MAG: hypothetical protein C5B48_10575 [Candidatus Rokuibacteriota bacterium]|nr:MAG: hypothetical protein C5B48_10575 [Candidatus Rokubacteria bacterium]
MRRIVHDVLLNIRIERPHRRLVTFDPAHGAIEPSALLLIHNPGREAWVTMPTIRPATGRDSEALASRGVDNL